MWNLVGRYENTKTRVREQETIAAPMQVHQWARDPMEPLSVFVFVSVFVSVFLFVPVFVFVFVIDKDKYKDRDISVFAFGFVFDKEWRKENRKPEQPQSRFISKQRNPMEPSSVKIYPVWILCPLFSAPLHPKLGTKSLLLSNNNFKVL